MLVKVADTVLGLHLPSKDARVKRKLGFQILWMVVHVRGNAILIQHSPWGPDEPPLSIWSEEKGSGQPRSAFSGATPTQQSWFVKRGA